MATQAFYPGQPTSFSAWPQQTFISSDWYGRMLTPPPQTDPSLIVNAPNKYEEQDIFDEDVRSSTWSNHVENYLRDLSNFEGDLWLVTGEHSSLENPIWLRLPSSVLPAESELKYPVREVIKLNDTECRLLVILKTLDHFGWSFKHPARDRTSHLLNLYKEGCQLVQTHSNGGRIMHILAARLAKLSQVLKEGFQAHKTFLERRSEIELNILGGYGGNSEPANPQKLHKSKQHGKLWEWFNAIPLSQIPNHSQMQYIADEIGERVGFVKCWVSNRRRSEAKKKARVPSNSLIRPALRMFLDRTPLLNNSH